MKLVTRFQLASKSTSQLRGLYRDIFNTLVGNDNNSHERRNALASLSNYLQRLNVMPMAALVLEEAY